MEICPACLGHAFVDVAEVYYDLREFSLVSCCEENLQGWVRSIEELDRRTRSEWFARKTGIKVREILASGELDYGLELRAIDWPTAKAFVQHHHRHNDPPQGWMFGAGVYNGNDLVGVATAGRPVSAALQSQGCFEITRVCVKDLPGLTWNACSMLYGACCREAFKRGYTRVITYSLLDEEGTSLRAAGFCPVVKTTGGSWNRTSRPRSNKASTASKIRWERWQSGEPSGISLQLPLDLVVA